MYSALIIEDEKPARDRVKKLLETHRSQIKLLDECSTVKQSVNILKNHTPDIIFLDIQLKDHTGFEVLEQATIPETSIVIFTTAYDKYAVKAFEYFAYDYLLKPYKDERFHTSVRRALKKLTSDFTSSADHKIDEIIAYIKELYSKKKSAFLSNIPVRLNDRTYFLDTNEIEYIEADGYYAELVVNRKKHIIRESLTNLEQQLNPDTFLRIHRSTIINQNFIKELIRIGYGDYELKMKDGKRFRVSKSYKKNVAEQLGI